MILKSIIKYASQLDPFKNDVIKCCKMMSSNVAQWCHYIATSQQCGEIVFHAVIFTARKRSLGQGNIFTPVCHSVHRGACMVALGGLCMVAPGGMHGCSGGACMVLFGGGMPGGMHGFIWGGMRGFIRGHAWFYLGGRAWFYLEGAGGHAWFYWGCVVLFEWRAWFYSGGMHGFIRGACVVLFGGVGGGVCGFSSFFGYNEIRSMSGRYASYWNAFLYFLIVWMTSSSCQMSCYLSYDHCFKFSFLNMIY